MKLLFRSFSLYFYTSTFFVKRLSNCDRYLVTACDCSEHGTLLTDDDRYLDVYDCHTTREKQNFYCYDYALCFSSSQHYNTLIIIIGLLTNYSIQIYSRIIFFSRKIVQSGTIVIFKRYVMKGLKELEMNSGLKDSRHSENLS